MKSILIKDTPGKNASGLFIRRSGVHAELIVSFAPAVITGAAAVLKAFISHTLTG